MRQMMQAVMTLREEDRSVLVATRVDVLFDLDEQTRTTLTDSHMAVLQRLGERAMMDEMKTIEASFPSLPPTSRPPSRP